VTAAAKKAPNIFFWIFSLQMFGNFFVLF